MNDNQLLRYSRQIMLPQIDVAGQQTLLAAKVLLVGAGGLGSPAALYLAAAGVGELTLYDDDQVELSNLQRQVTHYTADIGLDKVISSQQTLNKLNPEVKVIAHTRRLQGEALQTAVATADVVLDCSDNFATRFAINAACVQHQTPLVSGAAIRFEGQIAVFTPGQNSSPCYQCLYPQTGEELANCATNGILAPITGIIGCMQALETIKLLLNIGQTLVGRLLLFDGLNMEWRQLHLKPNPHCLCCATAHNLHSPEK